MNTVLKATGIEGGYGSVQILNGIDLHVGEGEFVTVIGPNGCGKSTFLKYSLALPHSTRARSYTIMMMCQDGAPTN